MGPQSKYGQFTVEQLQSLPEQDPKVVKEHLGENSAGRLRQMECLVANMCQHPEHGTAATAALVASPYATQKMLNVVSASKDDVIAELTAKLQQAQKELAKKK